MVAAFTGHRPDKLWGWDMRDPRYRQAINVLKKIIINEGDINDVWDGRGVS